MGNDGPEMPISQLGFLQARGTRLGHLTVKIARLYGGQSHQMWSPVTGSETSLLLASAGPIWRNPVEAARLIRAARRRPSSLTRGRDATRRDTRTMDPEESTPEDLDAYFVSFREVKTGPCHRYYLIRGDSRRGQTLGAVGVPSSSGAASGAQPAYDYRNARNFTNHGTLATSSKRELMTWLDGVVAEGVLAKLRDPWGTTRKLAGWLRPGGRLQLADILVEKEVSAAAKQRIDLWTG